MRGCKIIVGIIVILSIFHLSQTASLSAEDILPDYKLFNLNNGLQVVLTKDSRLPMVDFALVVKTGSAADSAGTSGLAMLTAEMLRMGTANYSRDELAGVLETLGGTGEVEVRRDYTQISGNFLAQDLDEGLKLLAEVVLYPTLDEESLNSLRRRFVSNRIHERRLPEVLAEEMIFARYFGNNGYGLPVEGKINGLENITIDNIRTFYERNYRPNNAALIVAGDFDAGVIRKTIERLFGFWKPGDVLSSSMVNPVMPDSLEILLVNKPDAPVTYFLIGCPTVAAESPELAALALFNYSLGAGGEVSHLYRYLVRERGLVHDIRSGFEGTRWYNMFAITGSTEHNLAAAAVEEVLKILSEDIMLRPPVAELEAAKHYHKGVLYQTLENTAGVANVMSSLTGLELGLDYYKRISEVIKGIKPAFIRDCAARYLNPSRMTIIIVGPELTIKRDLKQLGTVRVLEIGHD